MAARGRDRAGPPPDPGGGPDADLDALLAEAARTARRLSATVAGATLLVLHAVVGWLTASLGLVAPAWAVGTLLAVWLLLGVAGWRLRARRPLLAMLVPFLHAAVVLAAVTAGGAAFGWSA